MVQSACPLADLRSSALETILELYMPEHLDTQAQMEKMEKWVDGNYMGFGIPSNEFGSKRRR